MIGLFHDSCYGYGIALQALLKATWFSPSDDFSKAFSALDVLKYRSDVRETLPTAGIWPCGADMFQMRKVWSERTFLLEFATNYSLDVRTSVPSRRSRSFFFFFRPCSGRSRKSSSADAERLACARPRSALRLGIQHPMSVQDHSWISDGRPPHPLISRNQSIGPQLTPTSSFQTPQR